METPSSREQAAQHRRGTPGIGSGHSAHPSRPPVGKPDQMMLLSVSRGSEPGSVGGGEFCIGSPSAFEFGEPGGFGSKIGRASCREGVKTWEVELAAQETD